MDSLPDEILLRIFSFIPSKWRREAAAFVCRQWYRIATDRQFTENEEIILSKKLYAFEQLAPYLANSHRNTFNLHFFRDNFQKNELFYRSWRLCGAKISSLNIDTSHLEPWSLRDILNFCPNLVKLSCDFIRVDPTKDPLSAPSVTSLDFEILLSRKNPKGNELYKFLSVFPKLTDLKLRIRRWNRAMTAEELFDPICTYNDDTGKCLRTISFQGGMAHVDSVPWLSKMLNRLDNAKMVFNMWLWFDELPAPIGPQLVASRITILNVWVHHDFDGRTSKFLLDVLNNCTNLVYLNISMRWGLAMNVKLVEKILASRLKTLKYESQDTRYFIPEDFTQGGNFVPNYSLEGINLSGKSIWSEELWAVFLEYSKNLRKVEVSAPTYGILQNIFKHQKRLKSLTLDPWEQFTISEVDRLAQKFEETYCISELKELEYLHISYHGVWEEDSPMVKNIMSSLLLPALKIFKIHIQVGKSTAVMLNTLVDGLKNSPYLEFIKFKFTAVREMTIFAPLLETLKHLKILVCDETCHYCFARDDDIDEKTAYEFFRKCPSLRKFDYNSTSFFYNILTSKIYKFNEADCYIDFRNNIYHTCDPDIYF